MTAPLLTVLLAISAPDVHPLLLAPPPSVWFQSDARNPNADWVICLRLSSDEACDAVTQCVENLGGRVRSRLSTIPVLVCDIDRDHLPSLMRRSDIVWIEPAPPRLEPCMDSARAAVSIDTLHAAPLSLRGEGQRVALIETGLPDTDHPDLADVEPWDTGGTTVHATHVAGIIGGDGSGGGGAYTGAAPAATIDAWVISGVDEYYFFSDPGNLESIYEDQLAFASPAAFNQSLGSNVQQNGYPCSLHGDYGVTSELLDGLARGSLGVPATSVWAVGNERALNDCTYNYGTIGQPATAKNVVSVGAVYSDTNVVSLFSSWGPTDDGRIKPDLVAPGSQLNGDYGITSCAEGGGYVAMSGTSMAAPIVSGTIALLAQAHADTWPDESPPRPATWRSILCHTATDLWQTGPDYRYGWGLLDAPAAHECVTRHDWAESSVSQGQIFTTIISIADDAALLKVTLAWDDPPALAGTVETLVHDLDLFVVDPDGTVHRPWTLNPSNPSAAATQANSDHINPIEQVFVEAPIAGTWQVHVLGSSVMDPAGQTFTIVADPGMARTLVTIAAPPSSATHWQDTPVSVSIDANGEDVVEGTPTLHALIDDGPLLSTPLTPGPAPTWTGIIPAAGCGSTITWWVETESTLTGTHTLPLDAPLTTFTLTVGDDYSQSFSDSFDTDLAWTVESTASSGHWDRAVPSVACEDDGEPSTDAETGSVWCAITGPGSPQACNDVDGGCTSFVSPPMDASREDQTLSYSRWFSNDTCGHHHDDGFTVEFSIDDGSTWVLLEYVEEDEDDASGGWVTASFELSAVTGFSQTDAFRLRFTACDEGSTTCVEAAVDAVRLTAPPCVDLCRHDIASADGAVDVTDLLAFIEAFGTDDRAADFDEDGVVSIDDLLTLMSAWGACP